MRVLILEDETILAISMQEFLEDSGYEVEHYTNSENAFDAIYNKPFDLLLLDVKVAGEQNGFELLSSLRKADICTPAIFITSLTDIEDLTEGYACGGCDYIRKPFDLAELKLRVEQVIKLHCFSSTDTTIDLLFDYLYDTKKMQLILKDKVIVLGKTETKILELLIKQRGSVVSYEMFWEEIWGEWIDPTNIRVQVGNLRKKLEKDFIKNIRGVGYSIDL
ncbi:MAG TPA: response regulator transcription factor [Sulfurovum sp.]|nr:response regulator transcription factor [Sulfurovum sp.]HIM94632.1 response regulator transcription factor [Campylobacterales bacterium]